MSRGMVKQWTGRVQTSNISPSKTARGGTLVRGCGRLV